MKYVFFDLDGTVTESAPGIINSVVYAIKKLGVRMPSEEELLKFVGPPLSDSFVKYCGKLMEPLLEEDLSETKTEFDVPMFFISGSDDWNCPCPVMIDYCEKIGGQYVLMEGYDHYVHAGCPEEFAKTVKNMLKDI